MLDTCLWPPLDDIRRNLSAAVDVATLGVQDSGSTCGTTETSDGGASTDVPDLLRALIERRAGVAALPNSPTWSPGDIVGLRGEGQNLLGVLLDEPQGLADASELRVWRGWLTAAEVDWAGAHDVVFEPEDEPFDPAVGIVQTWNPVQVLQGNAPLLGRLSASRLAAVRAVQDDAGVVIDNGFNSSPPRPGQIALRAVGGFTVLTGTPLGADDPRRDYQALYRAAAKRLSVVAPVGVSVPTRSVLGVISESWQRLMHGWPGNVPARLIVAASFAGVLGLIVQGWYLPPAPMANGDDEIRFRSLPVPQPRAVLSVRWRDAADVGDVAALLRAIGGDLVGGPDAAGRWRVSVADPVLAQRAMLASPLVAEVSGP